MSTSRNPWSGESRLLLFSHDTYGLGHLRRCSTIAKACAREVEGLSTLYVSGSTRPYRFGLPNGCDVLKLPSLTKSPLGSYEPRSLEVSADLVISLRRGLLVEAAKRFAPHVVLIDHAPLGASGELEPMLQWLREYQPGTRVILGMRDVIDEPSRVEQEFGSTSLASIVESYYDEVLVYGDRRIFDPIDEYALPASVAQRMTFTGYVCAESRPRVARPGGRPRILVQSGGGEDGARLYETVLDALSGPLVDEELNVDLILGPMLHAEERKRILARAGRDRRVRAGGFRADFAAELRDADLVISMAGANSVAEILATGVQAILAPRQYPRREQRVRADRLESLGLARSVDVDRNDAPERLAELMRQALSRTLLPKVRISPDCQGATTAARILARVLSSRLTRGDSSLRAVHHG